MFYLLWITRYAITFYLQTGHFTLLGYRGYKLQYLWKRMRDCCLVLSDNFQSYHGDNLLYLDETMMISIYSWLKPKLEFDLLSSLKTKVYRLTCHLLGHIFLTPSRLVVVLYLQCCLFSSKATNTNF